jgi:16S rRNA (cytosine967-C5)-methyltransferase
VKKTSNRYLSQIKSAIKAFDFVQHDFKAKLPVDNSVTRYFRANKFLGSRDRRMISRVIFGYYRWYGWLKIIDPESVNLEKTFLLAYILESRQTDDLINFWSSEISLDHIPPQLFNKQPEVAIQEKLQYINLFDPKIQLNHLVPDYTPHWVMDKLAYLQTRPNLWLRSIYPDAGTTLTFLREKEIPFQTPALQSSAIEVFDSFNINECSAYKKGELEIQDISSQIIGLICNPNKSDVWWDVCAGSGGKSLHLSALVNGSARIYATEIRFSALKALKKRVQRKWSNIVPMNWDGQSKLTFPSTVTKAIVDVPCSCSGTWRRNPEIRWQLEPKDIKGYANTQRNILKNLAQNYPDIRSIIYATCSIMPEENELTIVHFLKQNPNFSILPIKHPLTQRIYQEGIHISPPESDGNFMYAAILNRNA